VRHYDPPLPFKESIRLTLPAARLDRITLTVAPSSCAGQNNVLCAADQSRGFEAVERFSRDETIQDPVRTREKVVGIELIYI